MDAPKWLRCSYGGVLTSAAAAAAALGSLSEFPSPRVRGGPPTFLAGAVATLAGMEALVAGGGAEPRVRPGPSKPSFDCLPQRLPMRKFCVRRGFGERGLCMGCCWGMGGDELLGSGGDAERLWRRPGT